MTEVLKDGVGQTQVALGILEIDGIDLVGHGGRTYLAGFDFLLEILHGDIGPDVAAEIDENDVNALAVVEIGSHVVVVLNLSGVLLTLQTQMLGNKIVAKSAPINHGIGSQMGVEIASGTAELGTKRNLAEILHLST